MRILRAIAIVTILAPLPALAYTQEDADACTPDAFRLCQAAIPDEGRVAACLVQHRADLSAGCKAVFSRPSTAQRATPTPASNTSGRKVDSHGIY